MRNDLAERVTGRVQEACQTQTVDYRIVDIEQQLVTVAFGFGGGKARLILPLTVGRSRLSSAAHGKGCLLFSSFSPSELYKH
jgi:hypothetical protein